MYLNDKADVESIYCGQNFQILKFFDKVEYLFENEIITINGHFKAVDVSGDSAYLLVDNKLYKLKNGKIEKTLELLIDFEVNKIYCSDHLLLVGKIKDCGVIVEYTKDLKEVMKYTYGEDNDLNIFDIVKYQNSYYLACSKTAHSPNGYFQNVGNYNETKTILIKLNNRMNVENVLYINNKKTYEKPIFMDILNEEIYFVVETKSINYYYKTGLDFNELILVKEGNNCQDILLGLNGEFIEFDDTNNLKLKTYDNELSYDICNILNFKIENSLLKVWALENDDIYQYEIEEYHIDYLNEFNIGFNYGNYDFEQNLNNTDVIKIESLFSNVEVYNQTIFTKNVPGVYDLNLVVKRPNLLDIQLSTKVNVQPYVNIQNNGVYRTGLILYFLGVGTLNGEAISNGYTITKEDEYLLEVKDAQNNITSYQFSCIDDYYISDQPTLKIDYFLEKNKNQQISINVDENSKVEDLIIDNQSISFTQNKGKVIFELTAGNNYEIKTHTINKIKIDNLWYDINKEIVVKTIKQAPKIDIHEKEGENLSLDFLVDDPDESLQKLVMKINDKVVFSNYFENLVYSLDEYKNKNIKITFEYYYDLGDNIIRSKEVILLEGTIKNSTDLVTIDAQVNNCVEKFNLNINTSNIKNLKTIKVLDSNITSRYSNEQNNLPIYISIILTIIVIIVISYIIFRRRIKKKTT